ncbi:MAG: cytolysin (calcineurin-like family phosphatase) [Planctomycetota bacterium]|jgi:cytolysin (calcineurin-like family phosphatase)
MNIRLPSTLTLLAILSGCVVSDSEPQVERVRATRNDFTFFAIGDPQINLVKWGTAGTEQIIDKMNALPGQLSPFGGTIAKPRGVLIAGDLVDDIRNPDNWDTYQKLFDVRGAGRLRFPVFEGVGNHDLDSRQPEGTFNPVQRDFIERNAQRDGAFCFDRHGYHYSWDWDQVHFVCLNIFPGNSPRPVYGREARWNDPKRSLDFLRSDLRDRVGASGRPVCLMWHYGLRGWGLDKWWTKRDLVVLRELLEPYNVVLILHGHEHRFERYSWQGIDVVMAPAPQFAIDRKVGEMVAPPKGFVVVRFIDDKLQLAHHDANGWQETWEKTIR